MAASDHVSQAQSGRYQYHLTEDERDRSINVYKGDYQVGSMSASKNWRFNTDRDYEEVSEIDFAQVAKGHRAIVPTMLGLHHNLSGGTLKPSTSLSSHSSRMVRKLQGRGLVTDSFDPYPTNDMTFARERRMDPADREGERLNTGQVNEGRKFMRQKLQEARRGRK